MEPSDQPMAAEPETTPKRGIRSEWVVAMSAMLVSMATLFVYIYQAKIMQGQQHASVWPYVEWTMTISSEEIYLSVVNKGVGPAKINSTRLEFDGEAVADVRDMLRKATNGKSDSLSYFGATVDYRVLAPGEEIRLFQLHGDKLDKIPDIMSIFDRTRYFICFCSIYEECWTTQGATVVEGCENLK